MISGFGEPQPVSKTYNQYIQESMCARMPDQRNTTAFILYRFLVLGLSSLFFLVSAGESVYVRGGTVLLLAAAAFGVVYLYKRYRESTSITACIIMGEIAGLSLIAAITGGFDSPFVLYAITPLLYATLYLAVPVTWIFLGFFLGLNVSLEMLLSGGSETAVAVIRNAATPILTTVVLVLVMQVLVRLNIYFLDHSKRIELQQQELFSAYQDLYQSYHVFQNLSNFQREVASYKSQKDIFMNLNLIATDVFPFQKTAVLLPREPLPAESLVITHEFEIITARDMSVDSRVLEEVKLRWQELSGSNSSKDAITGEGREWLALPFLSSNKKITAVFVGWLKPGSSLNAILEKLKFFTGFTEQAVQRLNILKQQEQTLKQLSSLYQAVETISSRSNPKELCDLFAAYGRALTGCEKVIFWMDEQEDSNIGPIYSVKGKRKTFPENTWQDLLLQCSSEIRTKLRPVVRLLEDSPEQPGGKLICVPIRSGSRYLGLMAGIREGTSQNHDEIIQTFSVLAELSAIAIERNITDLFSDKLLLIEEQNRIANEIHDSISQNIFSIVYGIDALYKESQGLLKPGQQERLSTIRDLASETAKELRMLIYRLSPRKRGDETFVKEIKSYLDGLASINQIDLALEITGKEEFLNPPMRKAFYRIVKEATGNAVRHGKCSGLTVELQMTPFSCVLKISDNGNGFDMEGIDLYKPGHKLGLVNMRELALSLQGSFTIESAPGNGTTVLCSVPTSPISSGKALQ